MNVLIYPSPVGPLTLVSSDAKLVGCYFANGRLDPQELVPRGGSAYAEDPVFQATRRELDQYFARRLRKFTVPVAPRGTEFQRNVWKALRSIPFGKTVSYGHIAKHLGKPAAVRAVGAANGRNPICIIIPCHRVIGADGSLTGFGGGLERKEYLLALERDAAQISD